MSAEQSLDRKIILCVAEAEETVQKVTAGLSDEMAECYEVLWLQSGEEAIRTARAIDPANSGIVVCVARCELEDMRGDELLPEIQRISPRAATALVATSTDIAEAIRAVKEEKADRVIDARSDEEEYGVHVKALIAHSQRLSELRNALRDYPSKHLFVTGATGFLGTRFICDVLRCTSLRITALSRSRKGVPHDARLPFTEADYPERLRFVEGDVREADLGLAQADQEMLRESIDEIWHLAALTSFDEVLRDATFAVNLKGTENVLKFSHRLKRLRWFNHISTAYVCGATGYPNTVAESLNDRPSSFRNPYEESKFEAEQLVAASGLPYTIFRPSIILGETVSGRCDGQTIYNIAKMVRLAKLLGDKDCTDRGLPFDHHSFRVVADTESHKNIIAVDDVISIMLRTRATNPEPGKIFHITHPHPVAIVDLVETIADLLDTQHYEIVDSLEGETLSVPEQALDRVARIFRPYMVASDPNFDRSNVQAAIGSVELPPITTDRLSFTLDAFYSQFFGADYKAVAIEA